MQAGIYRHYKSGFYQVLGIGEHTETEERMVVYVSLSGIDMPGPRLRIRPLDGPGGWNEPVAAGRRFEYIGDELP